MLFNLMDGVSQAPEGSSYLENNYFLKLEKQYHIISLILFNVAFMKCSTRRILAFRHFQHPLDYSFVVTLKPCMYTTNPVSMNREIQWGVRFK